jgi:hypothetical protein
VSPSQKFFTKVELDAWNLVLSVLEPRVILETTQVVYETQYYVKNLNLHQAVETPADPNPMRALVLCCSLPSFNAQAMARGTEAETVLPNRLWVL